MAPGSSAFILLTMDFTETDRATEKITANARIVITRYLPLNDIFFNGIKPLDRKMKPATSKFSPVDTIKQIHRNVPFRLQSP